MRFGFHLRHVILFAWVKHKFRWESAEILLKKDSGFVGFKTQRFPAFPPHKTSHGGERRTTWQRKGWVTPCNKGHGHIWSHGVPFNPPRNASLLQNTNSSRWSALGKGSLFFEYPSSQMEIQQQLGRYWDLLHVTSWEILSSSKHLKICGLKRKKKIILPPDGAVKANAHICFCFKVFTASWICSLCSQKRLKCRMTLHGPRVKRSRCSWIKTTLIRY